METVGLFRTRVGKDGGVEIWAKGWRLESQVPALVPVALGVAFLFSPFPLPARAAGCALLLGCAWITLRLSRIGFRADVAGITVNKVVRSRNVPWNQVEGFIGARNEHEGRCVLLTTDGERLPSPGTLDPDEMDPFWGDGDASAVDQLNRLALRFRRAFSAGDEPTTAIDLTVAEGGAADHSGPDAESPGARRLRSL
jgi:hypothetical protein